MRDSARQTGGRAAAAPAEAARLLLELTELPVGEIAFLTGFASTRGLSESVRRSCGQTPTGLRSAPSPAPHTGSAVLQLRLPLQLPLAAGPLMAFHGDHAVAGCEEVTDDGWFVTATRLPRAPGVLALRPAPAYVDARLRLTDARDLSCALNRCRRLLDLDAEPAAVDAHLSAVPLMRPLVAEHPGLRLPGSADAFATAVRAVLGQQVSVKAARTFTARLVAQLGSPLHSPVGSITRVFPTAAQIADADLSTLGLTGARQRTLRELAASVRTGQTVLDGSVRRAEAVRQLLTLPGIGPWTAGYVALRALGDPDVLLGSDLAVRAELRVLTGDDSPAALAAVAQEASPWSSYATQHLWTHFTRRTAR